MQNQFILRTLSNLDLENEIKKIGFDNSYASIFSEKLYHLNIKIYDLKVAQANILKQTALSVGADCATHKDVITGNQEYSNVILCGSSYQIRKIAQKLSNQPFNLKKLGEALINNLNKKNKNEPKLVGILNITDNSFSDGGLYLNYEDAKEKFISLISDGSDIIDIGAESTKPFSSPISDKIQLERLLPIVEFSKNYKISISIDTRSSIVAKEVLKIRNCIINDVSGFEYDKQMPKIIGEYGASVIIQHSKGTPLDMQVKPQYEDLIEDIYFALKNKIEIANNHGITDIIIDPGIGFGKTKENNIEIINRIEEFQSLNYPIMLGISRKSFLGIKDDNNDEKDALSLAYGAIAIEKNVDYLRVHNVKLHKAYLNSLKH